MKIIDEFKKFAIRGNVIDMAVGVIIGTAFHKIVDSLVKDIIMPPIGKILGGVNFKHLYLNLSHIKYPSLEAAEKAGAPIVKYGSFINTVVDFLIIAWVVFVMVRLINRLRQEPTPADPTTKNCGYCFTSIPIQATRCPNCTSDLTDKA